MGEDLGGITYDKDAALYPGASFSGRRVRGICKDRGSSGREETEKNCLMYRTIEDAGCIGKPQGNGKFRPGRSWRRWPLHRELKKIVGKEQIVDKETKEYRPVEYGIL